MDQQHHSAAQRQPWADTPARTTRRGHFWVPGERVAIGGKTFQHGPMFVDWEAPEQVTQPYPIVLVHGGTLQGTEWLDTPDGRPGWAQRLVEAGYAVLMVDRPCHGLIYEWNSDQALQPVLQWLQAHVGERSGEPA